METCIPNEEKLSKLMESTSLRHKQNIYTHNGTFHTDDVVAYMILREIFHEHILWRINPSGDFDEGGIVVDIGQKHDPDNNRFDHHQPGFNERFSGKSRVKMASAGLVYKKYGREFIRKIINSSKLNDKTNVNGYTKTIIDIIFNDFYHSFIAEIDAIDNGVLQYPPKSSPLYFVNTNISNVVGKMNYHDQYNEEKQMERFIQATDYSALIARVILEDIWYGQEVHDLEYTAVVKAIQDRFNISPSGEIIVLDDKYKSLKQYVFEYERYNPYPHGIKNIKYAIFPRSDEWRVVCIGVRFKSRRLLKSMNDLMSQLDESEKGDVSFVHTERFIGSFRTKASAISSAKLSLTP